VLETYCSDSVHFEIFYPFNTLQGIEQVHKNFWEPLKTAFPDYEQRIDILIAGEYEGREWVSMRGHIAGSFFHPWIGIPPTQGLCYLRFGLNALIERGKIVRAYVLLDVLDVMRQADLYPLRRMPGSAELWPAPPADTGMDFDHCDDRQGATSLRIVLEMLHGLGEMNLKDLKKAEYSHHWHKNVNWYGPAGIGSTRGKRGFREYHGRLFLQAFPDRRILQRDHNGPLDGPGDYIQIGDGRFAVVSGWPCIRATHRGDGWLGLGPSGRVVEMRIADWYRLSEDNLLIENWVMIDILHILDQLGLDILKDMRYFADRTLRRWPD
jgi:predicted ester cyclase